MTVQLAEGRQELQGRTVNLTHLDRVVFPADGVTKGELVAYYDRVAPIMIRHVVDRPVALKRFPEGLQGDGFFQKNASPHFPDWVGHVEVAKRDGGTTNNVVVTEAACLPYLADQGTIELHSWLSRADDVERADQLVFDLDPPGDDVDAAREAARLVGRVLDDLELPTLLKTSGSAGYHVHVVIDRDGDVDVRGFAADVARLLARDHPEVVTDQHRKQARRGRVLVDYFRNGFGQTVVAPYSVRARPGAPVSTPIDWSELGRVDPQRYTLRNLFRRLGQRDDPWATMWDRAANLADARARLDARLEGR